MPEKRIYRRVLERAHEAPKEKFPPAPEVYSRFMAKAHEMISKDKDISTIRDHVRSHFAENGEYPEHGMRHAEVVARLAGTIAGMEAFERNITGQKLKQVMKESIIAGYLHDIGRVKAEQRISDIKEREKELEKRRGFVGVEQFTAEEEGLRNLKVTTGHDRVGKEEAESILSTYSISTSHVIEAIVEHENPKWSPSGDALRDVVVSSVYDADKVVWGPPLSMNRAWKIADSLGIPSSFIIADMEKGWDGAILGKIKTYTVSPDGSSRFRTSIARKYAPELILKGVESGKKMVQILKEEAEKEA